MTRLKPTHIYVETEQTGSTFLYKIHENNIYSIYTHVAKNSPLYINIPESELLITSKHLRTHATYPHPGICRSLHIYIYIYACHCTHTLLLFCFSKPVIITIEKRGKHKIVMKRSRTCIISNAK